jgi:hypothetical protein
MVCCREHHEAFHVNLPSDFKGQVQVECGGYGPTPEPVSVDESGHGVATVCTKELVDVYVVQNGKQIKPESMQWMKTGDGIPTGLEFDVK